jgi:hypothetical protein
MARIDEIEEMIKELELCVLLGVGTTLDPRQACILLAALRAQTVASSLLPEDIDSIAPPPS